MQKKYGLFTAICMVIGLVIGSGVFFKAQDILKLTQGNLSLGVFAWLLGGAVMLFCVLAFSVMAQKHEKVNGLIDYAEATVGPKYAYYLGWFSVTIYLPSMASVLAWVSARYTLVFITSVWPNFSLLGLSNGMPGVIAGPECMALAMFYMVMVYAINALSPKLAGKMQTSTTVIKFIPLVLMMVVGILVGVFGPEKQLPANFQVMGAATDAKSSVAAVLAGVCATAFAYEGWIVATSINAELRDAKKNLPRALLIGAGVCIATYVLYYLGVAGGTSVEALMEEGATVAFKNIFGGVFGNVLNLFVAISCLGTLNGLMMGTTRGMYALAARKEGPNPELFGQVDPKSNMATNSSVFGLCVIAFWGLYFYVSQIFGTFSAQEIMSGTPLAHVPFMFDSSEIPIITIYAMYLPIFFCWMAKEKDEPFVRRFLLPILAVIASLFVIYACVVSKKMTLVWYLIVYVLVMLVGGIFYRKNKKTN